jgi:CRISPR-associated endonuclease/helicase Cas3
MLPIIPGSESDWPAILLKDCWAKTDPETNLPSLTVQDHCLTVGWVARELSTHLPASITDIFPDGWNTLIAAHDIGKITPGFQLKCPLWKHYEEIGNQVNKITMATNHAVVSQWHLQTNAHGAANRRTHTWLMSTGAHHGSYPYGTASRIFDEILEGGLEAEFKALRDQLLESLIQEFGDLPTESAKWKTHAARIHLLTGFTIFSDWIGSNTDWFPASLSATSVNMMAKTSDIIQQLCLDSSPRRDLTFGQLFTNPAQSIEFIPRPMQQTLLDAIDAPGLYIVEAPMGMGKTEAALAAAYKRCTEGCERGIYFALPTQLTSDRIHTRINQFLDNTIDGPTYQTLVHGNAWLRNNPVRKISTQGLRSTFANPENEENDTLEAMRWYSSSRKSLIAPYGTGTIDQALLAILPARFAALRYFALAGKVIIIDEVHSFDPYMSALIDRLITYLREAGSTVIILSATLTAARRKKLVKAAGGEEDTSPSNYPLITKVSKQSDSAEHFAPTEKLENKGVALHHQHFTENDDSYWQSIADAVSAGANVVVIRNTVALAQETYRNLKNILTAETSNENTGIIHSRFPDWQRQKNEKNWVERLGKDPARRPSGSLLVSTQVVEQSVDIDADLMVTDLAPIDLILQRIGRLHRHNHQRPEGFATPSCHILHPPADWNTDANMLKEQLAPHHFIYPPLALWQAATTLGEKTIITLPTDIRPLLESASTLTPDQNSPGGVQQFLADSQQDMQKQLGTATTRGVFSSALEDREGAQTRYNMQPSAHLILLKGEPQETGDGIKMQPLNGAPITIRPGEFSYPLTKALHTNAVRIPRYLVRAKSINLIDQAPEWLKLHMHDAILTIVQDDTAELILHPQPDSQPFTLAYNHHHGITFTKNEIYAQPFTEPEEDWF